MLEHIKRLKSRLLLASLLLLVGSLHAAESLNYSGRLVNPDGRPVTGDVDLLVELAYSGSTTNILCSKPFTAVPLNNGLFYLKVDFDCNPPLSINEVLTSIPINQTVVVRVTNTSATPVKVYPFQAFYSVPFSKVSETSKQLAITGTTAGQVLKWDGSKWVAGSESGTGSGSVTEIATGTGLTGGPLTTSGTISIADDGVGNTQLAAGILRSKLAAGTANYFVVNSGTGALSEISGASAITLLGLGTAAMANIGLAAGEVVGVNNLPSCLSGQLMRVTAPPTVTFSCEYPLDATKLALDGSGTMTGALNMGTHKITSVSYPTANEDAATKKYVDDEVSGVNASQWTTGASLIYYTGGKVGIGTDTPGEALDVVGNIRGTGSLSLKSDNANYVELQAPASLVASLTFKLPATLGAAGQVLARVGTDGSLEWKDVATTATNLVGDITGPLTATEIGAGKVGTTEIADSSIANADIAAAAGIVYSKLSIADDDIALAKVNGLVTALAGKEPTIATGATTQYIRGDKSLATLSTSVVPEGTNLYFTKPLVLGTDLGGYAVGSGALATSDTILQAFGKLEGQIGAVVTASGTAYVDVAGDTMTGNLNMGTKNITNLANPASAQDAATRSYVDSQITASNIWTVSGSDIYRASNNVGIGTTTPTHSLNVITAIALDRFGGSSPHLVLRGASGTIGTPTATASGNGMGKVSGNNYDGSSWYSGASLNFFASELITGSNKGSALAFTTTLNGTAAEVERMRISNDGNVGIGTLTPNVKLMIDSDGSTSNVRIRSEANTNNPNVIFFDRARGSRGAESDIAANDYIGTIGANAFVNGAYRAGGRIDIMAESLSGTNYNSYLTFRTASGVFGNVFERMRISSLGNIGIGTTTPASILDITSTTSGILIPRMTTVQRDAIATPSGMQVYNTTTNKINFHNSTAWIELGVAGAGVTSITASTGLTGGTITSSGTIAVDVGIAAGKIPQLDSSARLPAVDGSLLTNISPDNLGSVVPVTKGGTGLAAGGAANTFLGTNAAGTAMEYKTMSAATPLTLTHGAGTAALDLGTVPTTKGGTGLAGLTGNKVYTSNALGTALQTFTCSIAEFMSFNALGEPICGSVSSLAGFVNNGNSFTGTATLGTNDNFPLEFETNGTSKMSILANGNVGIGTTAPGALVDIVRTSDLASTAAAPFVRVRNLFDTVGDGVTTWNFAGYEANSGNGRVRTFLQSVYESGYTGGLVGTWSNHPFKIITNSSEKMRITADGNVGIGTTTPAAALDVYGKANAAPYFQLSGQRTDGTAKSRMNAIDGTFSFQTGEGALDDYSGVTTKLSITRAGLVGIGTATPLAVLSVAVPQVKTTVSGITSSFQSTNDAANPFGLRTMIYGGAEITNRYVTLQTTDWSLLDGGNLILQPATGNVGIGTATPAGLIHLSANGPVDMIADRATDNTSQAGFLFRKARGTIASPTVITSGDGLGYLTGRGYSGLTNGYTGGARINFVSEGTISSTAVPGLITFLTTPAGSITPAEVMRINSAGNVGIGTTTPATRLEVNGGTAVPFKAQRSATGTGNTIAIFHNPDTTDGNSGLATFTSQTTGSGAIETTFARLVSYFETHDHPTRTGSFAIETVGNGTLSEKMRITGAGNVGIGLTNPGYKLDVLGDINASGTVRSAGAALTSDIRLKENLTPVQDSLKRLSELKAYNYYWKDKKKFGDQKQLGLVAQEVEKVFPEAIMKGNDGFLAVSYANLVAPLIEAIKELFNISKEQSKDIALIKAENQKLAQENADMKSRLARLEKLIESQGRVPASVKAKK